MKWSNVRSATRILGCCALAALCTFVYLSTEMKKDPCSLLVWSAPPPLPSSSSARLLRVQDEDPPRGMPEVEGGEVTPCIAEMKTEKARRWAALGAFLVFLPLTVVSFYSDSRHVKRRSARQKERDERWRKREARLNAEAAELGEDH